MPEENKKVTKYDIDGYNVVSLALSDLLNSYPGLEDGEKITFSDLKEDSGIAFYPVSGAVIALEKKGVTGKVNQLCNYPFYIIYRTGTNKDKVKIEIKEFLDNIGRWLEQQPIQIDSKKYQLEEYPELSSNRKIEEISRLTPAYLDNTYENNVQDWIISMSLKYRNIFYKNV